MKPNAVLILALILGLFAPHLPTTEAQETRKTYRIGTLEPTTTSALSRPEFWDGLRELGWVEGTNLTVERRSADSRPERYADLAAELVRLKVDLIVTSTTPAAAAAKKSTGTIPIVFVEVGDPVMSGIVGSLAHPGGNVTGLASVNTDLSAKRLELLRAAVPRLTRVAVLACCLGSTTDALVQKFIEFLGTLGLGFAARVVARAQQTRRVWRIARTSAGNRGAHHAAFETAMKNRGYPTAPPRRHSCIGDWTSTVEPERANIRVLHSGQETTRRWRHAWC